MFKKATTYNRTIEFGITDQKLKLQCAIDWRNKAMSSYSVYRKTDWVTEIGKHKLVPHRKVTVPQSLSQIPENKFPQPKREHKSILRIYQL